ncbi:MAG TPA: polysaccharide deacetylase family protein [Armatimonadota bacterium]
MALLGAGCSRPAPPPQPPAPAAPTASPATPAAAPVVSQWLLPSRFRGQIISTRVRYFPRKLLALTFDDGPDPKVTPQVLATLAQYHAHATFFTLGGVAAGHEDLLRRIVAGGHAVGSHSYSHIATATPAQAASNLDRTEQLILKVTGHRPTLFRPPYGITKGELARQARQRGYAVILWTISSADTRPIGPEVIAHNVIHTPNPGDIVLMHDGSGHSRTAQALPQILRELGQAGFEFVTIPELMDAWDQWLRSQPAVAPPRAPKPAGGAPHG